MGFRATQISPPVLMIQISGWCQNVASYSHYNLSESDFLFSILLSRMITMFRWVVLIFSTFQKEFPEKLHNKILKNWALLSCSSYDWLHFDTNPKSVSLKMEEKSGSHGHPLFGP
jgi:hypothetical protein